MSSIEKLDAIVQDAIATLSAITVPADLENAKAKWLGKTGEISLLMKTLGTLSAEERPAAGARINVAKQQIEDALNARRDAIKAQALEAQLAQEALDVTLPGRGLGVGGLHPVTRTLARIETLFRSIGFEVADGPEIETDFYNFTALNIPENHPARAMHDTFYVDDQQVLRTHTSPVQVH